MKNIAHSILARLANLAREHHLIYNEVLMRYLLERVFYRIGISQYAKYLILKGGNLFVVWQKDFAFRPTMDADMLFQGDASPERLLTMFREILTLPCDDGVIVDVETLKYQNIREDTEYGGSRLTFIAHIGTTKTQLQIDIGVGDAITPNAAVHDYPVLLDLPVPQIRMYPPETVIAEKLETMVKREIANSRMKDFYDIWVLQRTFTFDKATLKRAISNTFERRGTPLPTSCPFALTDEFANDKTKQIQWNAFLRKSHLTLGDTTFADIIKNIREFILPILQ